MAGLEEDQKALDKRAAKLELDQWKAKVALEEDSKSRLILKKLEAEDEKKKCNKMMMDLIHQQEGLQRERLEQRQALQEQGSEVKRRKLELMEKLKRSRAQLQQMRQERLKLQQKFQICAQLPDIEVEYVKPKQDDDDITDDQPIRGQFNVCQKGELLLTGGQALITFEEEKVVSQILGAGRCSVAFEDHTLKVMPSKIVTEPLVQFQIHICVHRSMLLLSEVRSAMPQRSVEDRLALHFCRPSRGGAEVQSVDYNPSQGTARLTFCRPGVAERLAFRGEHTVDLDFQTVVRVAPVFVYQLHKFQNFCGAPRRTLLLDDIRDSGDEEEVQDQLEIHFQKPSNGGGEIEHTLYAGPGSRVWAVLSPEPCGTSAP